MIKLKKETIKVDSQAIKQADYNYETKLLSITFNNGKRYNYMDVPRFTFQGMRSSHSMGKFINKYILRNYKFKHVK